MVFSSSEDLDSGDQQTSLIPTVEEVVREEELQGEDLGSEQQFGVFKDFDFLDVELEDAEVRQCHGNTPPQNITHLNLLHIWLTNEGRSCGDRWKHPTQSKYMSAFKVTDFITTLRCSTLSCLCDVLNLSVSSVSYSVCCVTVFSLLTNVFLLFFCHKELQVSLWITKVFRDVSSVLLCLFCVCV